MSELHKYTGDTISITFDPSRCIHAAECVKGSPEVFDPERKPWVEPNAVPADQIAAVIRSCPTGALHYQINESDQNELPPPNNSVQVSSAGPLYMRGAIKVVDSVGEVIVADTRVALCRCGESKNKPFCDGRHRDTGFKDPGLIAPASAESGKDPSGNIEIKTVTDGPLVFTGRFELVDGKGDSDSIRENAALCRCGQSKNKPFCDGTHNQIGFKSDQSYR